MTENVFLSIAQHLLAGSCINHPAFEFIATFLAITLNIGYQGMIINEVKEKAKSAGFFARNGEMYRVFACDDHYFHINNDDNMDAQSIRYNEVTDADTFYQIKLVAMPWGTKVLA